MFPMQITHFSEQQRNIQYRESETKKLIKSNSNFDVSQRRCLFKQNNGEEATARNSLRAKIHHVRYISKIIHIFVVRETNKNIARASEQHNNAMCAKQPSKSMCTHIYTSLHSSNFEIVCHSTVMNRFPFDFEIARLPHIDENETDICRATKLGENKRWTM